MDAATLYINIIPAISFIVTLNYFVRKKYFFTEKKLVRFIVKWGMVLFLSWILQVLSNLLHSSFFIIFFATVGLLSFGVIAGGIMWFWLTKTPKKQKNKEYQV